MGHQTKLVFVLGTALGALSTAECEHKNPPVPGTAFPLAPGWSKPGLTLRGIWPPPLCPPPPPKRARNKSCDQKCPSPGQKRPSPGQAGAGSAQLSSWIYGQGFGSSQPWRGAISLSSVYKTQ